jgi:pimeloyl-ACP methyl ester carboxylesterase
LTRRFDSGTGAPIVVIPGVQGRWEWMRPALKAMAKRCRTISYSLCGDAGSGRTIEPGLGFENYLRQLDAVLDAAGLQRSAICGVSYGGLVALRYAATRPERVTALILVSSPAPGWTPTAQQQRWIGRPWISAPAFVVTSPGRLLPEITAALPGWRERIAFSVRHLLRIAAAPMKPPLMASRVTWTQRMDFQSDCTAVTAPTLVITGEDSLDRVVPVSVTRTYAALIAGARHETIERSGHIGLLTRPDRWAELVAGFVAPNAGGP